MKTCIKCNKVKESSEFGKNRDSTRNECRDCQNAYRREWYQKNKQYMAEYNREYWIKNKEIQGKKSRDWKKAHVEQIQQITKNYAPTRRAQFVKSCKDPLFLTYRQKMAQKWRKENPGRAALQQIRRRILLESTKAEIVSPIAIATRDKWHCYLCGKKVSKPSELSLDHIIPLSKGGTHTTNNIALAHRRCNSRKGNRQVGANFQLPLF